MLPQIIQQLGFLLQAGERVLQQGVPRLSVVSVKGLGKLPLAVVVEVHVVVVLGSDPSKHRGVHQGLGEVLLVVAVRHHPGVDAVPALRASRLPPDRLLLDGIASVHRAVHRQQRRAAAGDDVGDVRRRHGVVYGDDGGKLVILGKHASAQTRRLVAFPNPAADVNVVGRHDGQDPVPRVAELVPAGPCPVLREACLDAGEHILRGEVLAAPAAILEVALPPDPLTRADVALYDVTDDLEVLRASRPIV